jgi:site-specific recombinase XerD
MHLLEQGVAGRMIQQPLGHSDVRTTMTHTPLPIQGPCGVLSSADLL